MPPDTARRASKRPRTILYLLGVYIVLQFGWWAYLLVESNMDRLFMVVGEGSVFLFLLLFGMYRLKRAFDKEMALAEQERNFMMAVTHELRSPISSVKLFLQTVRKSGNLDEGEKRLTDGAVSEIDRLDGLIDNILLASRIESEHFMVRAVPTDIGSAVREALSVPSRSIGASHHTEFDLAEGARAKLDPQAFKSILINLYENAVNYSPGGSRIKVEVEQVEDKVCVRISDQGTGIPGEEKEKVLEKFYRSGEETVRESKGTGLGLYIVDRLTRLHQGTFRLLDSEGGGTVAELRFPSV